MITPDAPGEPGPVRGGAFYDAPEVLERYLRHRHSGARSPNHVMEEPAFLDELGPVAGLRVLDLGCGDAAIGRTLLASGCRGYLGIDGSAEMTRAAAATLHGTSGRVERADIEQFSAPPHTFDLIISRLALHYVGDLDPVLAACRRALSPGGRLLFTVVHPVITSPEARRGTKEARTDWIVDDYFRTGARRRDWMGDTVTWYHRTVEDYVTALVRARFAVTALRECAPRHDRFDGDLAEFDRRRRVPLFLLLAGSSMEV
ncbi:class I SAM-dependent DNA methyltransferase [Nonomuraea rhodomycinica]|uniref:Class I SAM-dependent methyltransferase n=1 Tax=Nonomuraea rhodomycinica TaxID=1712872 RepID=A0A7Y6IXK2_9ACTN|nr:class I SAM-dependent methyltransferase [Nonomuraea rhodomycinica]NUW46180.1 class I SAM-dependent methyltransferase [Nonomuraea rhodomycinica]